jgi:hypothetical protein
MVEDLPSTLKVETTISSETAWNHLLNAPEGCKLNLQISDMLDADTL